MYRDRVRADLVRYLVPNSGSEIRVISNINKIFKANNSNLEIYNRYDYPDGGRQDSKIGPNAYKTRIIKGEKD